MPYGSNPWLDVGSGTAGMQQSMANVALMQRQAQYRMQQDAARNALEQQRIGIERQAESRMGRATDSTIAYQGAEKGRAEAETKKYGQEYDMARQTMDTQQRGGRLKGYEGAPNIMSMVQDPFSGPQIMGDLRAANVVPQGQFQMDQQQLIQAIHGALAAQAFQQGMGTAASASRMNDPVQMGPSQTAFDPFTRQPVMQTGPAAMSDYQQRHLGIEQQRANGMDRHNKEQEALRLREVSGRIVGELGRGFQTGDLMEGARNELANSMGVSYVPEPPSTNTPTPIKDDRGFFGRVFNTESKQLKKPTKAQAMDYVKKYGVAGAHAKLEKDGYDTTDYAD